MLQTECLYCAGYGSHFNSKNKLATFFGSFVSRHGPVCSAVGIVRTSTAELQKAFSLVPWSETTEQTSVVNIP
jgi:hypothetical protein